MIIYLTKQDKNNITFIKVSFEVKTPESVDFSEIMNLASKAVFKQTAYKIGAGEIFSISSSKPHILWKDVTDRFSIKDDGLLFRDFKNLKSSSLLEDELVYYKLKYELC